MAFRSKQRKGNGSDKYFRLTGLWPSKSNDLLHTGRVKVDQLEDLIKRCEEALEADAPMVFSLWENDKKKSRKDPVFSLQCFVGDSEEKPRERGRSSSSSRRDKEEDDNQDDNDDDNQDDAQDDQEEDKEPTRKSKSGKANRETSKRKSSRTKPDW